MNKGLKNTTLQLSYFFKKASVIAILLSCSCNINAQVISVHAKTDSVWFKNVDWDSKPPSSNCSFPSVRYFRYKFEESQIIESFAKEETAKTKKDDWTEQDEEGFDRKYNEEHKEELDQMQEGDESDDLLEDSNNEIESLISSRWDRSGYSFCYNNCLVGDCYSYWEITEIKDALVEYKYQTGFSFLEEEEGPENLVEIDLDLVLHRSAWVYFKILCSCEDYYEDDYSEYVKVKKDPWARIDLTDTRFKPGYPFIKKIPIIPILGGVTGGAIATWLLIKEKETVVDCNWTGTTLQNNASCGEANGSISISIDPPGNYSYQWSNGDSNQNIENLDKGSYQVTVSDNEGACSLVLSAVIVETEASIDLSLGSNNASCGLNDGSAIVGISPPGSYEYLWSNGELDAQIENIPSGTYQVTVSIIGTNCSKSGEIVVGESEASFELDLSSENADCGQSNGSATVNVTPPGTYDYQWSNGETGDQIENIAAGNYQLTVTDSGDCSKVFSITLEENIADYILSVSSVPGNCIGEGGDIIINVETNAAGPIQLIANGPDGPSILTIESGQNKLSDHILILPGDWVLDVSDLSLAEHCVDSETISVPDNTVIEAVDDRFEMTDTETLNENILVNDEGLNLVVSENTEPLAGVLLVTAPGDIDYTPEPGQSGEYSFEYTVVDECENSAMALVTIIVRPSECEIEVDFDIVDANCGFSNGQALTTTNPDDEYSFAWSDGTTKANLENVGAGMYQLTVTDNKLQCSDEFEISIEELPNEFISQGEETQDSCGGSGRYTFLLESPGNKALKGELIGENQTLNVQLDLGQNGISDLEAGNYLLIVYDEDAGMSCADSIEFEILDELVVPEATDDEYVTAFETSLSENVLLNDSGRQITLTSIVNEVGGSAVFQANGDFNFTPQAGFVGLGTFDYIITDSCSNTATARVEIAVLDDCNFTVEFTTTDASCGFADGDIIAEVVEPGNYEYVWDNGITGPFLFDVEAGRYFLSVTDLDLNCELDFSVNLLEKVAHYIDNVNIIQPDCISPGEISFDASTPGIGPLFMQVLHPNGSENSFISAGNIKLSDYVDIVPGAYSVTITDLTIGAYCTDSFSANISMTGMGLNILLEAVIPPSTPTSSDGQIIIILTNPATTPYTIFIDGVIWGTATSETMTITGLASNTYLIHVMDASGCLSNLLTVTVPSINPKPYIGVGSLFNFTSNNNPENSSTKAQLNLRVFFGIQYPLFFLSNEAEIAMIYREGRPSYRAQNYSTLLSTDFHDLALRGQLGVVTELYENEVSIHWSIRAKASWQLGKLGKIEGTGSLKGRDGSLNPEVSLSYLIPTHRLFYSNRPLHLIFSNKKDSHP